VLLPLAAPARWWFSSVWMPSWMYVLGHCPSSLLHSLSLLILEKHLLCNQLSFFFVEQDPDLMAAEAMVALQDGMFVHSNSSPVSCMLQLSCYS
jgi:hypothetical protein